MEKCKSGQKRAGHFHAFIREPDHQNLTERHTYEAAEIRIRALDQNDNIVSLYQEPVYCRRRDQSPSLDLKSFPCREAWAALMSERPGKKASGF